MSYYDYDDNEFRWFDYLPLRDRVDLKTRAINKDYTLVLSPGGAQVKNQPVNTGYCDFEQRRCWVNCELATIEADPNDPYRKAHNASEKEQFITTVYVSAHERSHARWTDYRIEDFHVARTDGKPLKLGPRGEKPIDMLLHTVWNLLEDERIERLCERDFKSLRGYFRRGSRSLLRLMPQHQEFLDNPIQNDPNDIIGWVLRRRVLNRAGIQESCPLHPKNQERLAQIEPLLDRAFSAKNSREVVKIAREIIDILQIREFNKMMQQIAQAMGVMSGKRGNNDAAKGRSRGQADNPSTCSQPSDSAGEGDDEEDTAQGKGKGNAEDQGGNEEDGEGAEEDADRTLSGSGYTDASNSMKKARRVGQAAPYEELQHSIQSYLNSFLSLFYFEKTKPTVDYDRAGSRVDARRFMKDAEEPFKVQSQPMKRGKLDITLVIDESSSMSGHKELQAKRAALLFYEALRFRHSVRIALAPTGKILAESSDGEMGKAFIAGYGSHQGTCFNEVMGRELELIRNKRSTDTKYVILIADGESGEHDGTACRSLVSKYRRFGIRTMGIGVDLGPDGDQFFSGVFGTFFVSVRDAGELVAHMARVLKSLAIRTQIQSRLN